MRQDQQSWVCGYLDALFGTPFNAKDLDRYSYSAGRVEGEAIRDQLKAEDRNRKIKYRDFSEMPDDALRALASDLANPKEALKRIKAERRSAEQIAGNDERTS